MIESNSISKIVILVVGLMLAVVLGSMLVTDQVEALVWVIGASVLITCISLGRRIWLLIPFLGSLEITLRIPGQPSTLLLAQCMVLGFSVLLLLMRKLPFKLSFTELEWWMIILSLFVFQAYLRNPVGLNIFGGDTVGGKPYFLFTIGVVTTALMVGLRVPQKELKLFLTLSILGGLIGTAITLAGRYIGIIGYYIGTDYVRSDEVNYEDYGKVVDTAAASRIGSLATLSKNISLWIATFKSPLKACLHPVWGTLLIFTVAAAALSGFRNAIATVALTYFVGVCYRGGLTAIFFSGFLAFTAVVLLAIFNMALPLPPNIQRSLSFIPGTWEQRYVDDAKGSNDWRFEIWEEALTSDKWIQNKWMGDGLGFSSESLQRTMAMRKGVQSVDGFDEHREAILVSGDYHSGPVQTIRIIGYTGLFFLVLAQIRLAVHAHRQILRCRNTEWFPLSLFIGIPLIWGPVFFFFIFGDFKGGAASLLLGIAMIRMLQNNLPLPPYTGRSKTPFILKKNPDERHGLVGAPSRG